MHGRSASARPAARRSPFEQGESAVGAVEIEALLFCRRCLSGIESLLRFRAAVIPLAMAGRGRRPRVENPLPWEHFGGTMDKYYETPTAEELATHLRTAVQWTRDHAADCPAQAVIVYAWNEFDEGGWLCPTLSEGHARVEALGRALR